MSRQRHPAATIPHLLSFMRRIAMCLSLFSASTIPHKPGRGKDEIRGCTFSHARVLNKGVVPSAVMRFDERSSSVSDLLLRRYVASTLQPSSVICREESTSVSVSSGFQLEYLPSTGRSKTLVLGPGSLPFRQAQHLTCAQSLASAWGGAEEGEDV